MQGLLNGPPPLLSIAALFSTCCVSRHATLRLWVHPLDHRHTTRQQALREAGDLAKHLGHRLTFHPSEYVKIAGERPQ
jgi:UV DNA damage repair endonuclease